MEAIAKTFFKQKDKRVMSFSLSQLLANILKNNFETNVSRKNEHEELPISISKFLSCEQTTTKP